MNWIDYWLGFGSAIAFIVILSVLIAAYSDNTKLSLLKFYEGVAKIKAQRKYGNYNKKQ